LWNVGNGTCRRKARLDGRHTSGGGRAVAAVRFNLSRLRQRSVIWLTH
jgi:hypothetical protein